MDMSHAATLPMLVSSGFLIANLMSVGYLTPDLKIF